MNLSEARQLVDEAGQVLLRAAELIEQRGWCQGSYENNGAVCVEQAIRLATTPTNEHGAAEAFRDDAFRRLFKLIRESIPNWNDAPERTQAEVVAALRKAAWL